MKTIGVLVFEGVQSLDVCGPLDVFAETNAVVGPDKGYHVTLIGPDERPELPTRDTSRELIECIVRLSNSSVVYGSICTGAFLLGAAGLLDGRRVTTHWQNAKQLAARFPAADVDFDKIFLRDGRLITSAGVTAGIDLALALVREDHGPAISLAVAKRLVVVAQRLGGQSQFSPYVEMTTDAASPISSIATYVMENLNHALSVAELAATVAMSERTFARSSGGNPQALEGDLARVRVQKPEAHARGLSQAAGGTTHTVS
jgi:putative intracellular protease/amidase